MCVVQYHFWENMYVRKWFIYVKEISGRTDKKLEGSCLLRGGTAVGLGRPATVSANSLKSTCHGLNHSLQEVSVKPFTYRPRSGSTEHPIMRAEFQMTQMASCLGCVLTLYFQALGKPVLQI